MEKAIIGKKVGMSQIFDEAGKVIPVTVIQAGPCTVVQKKTEDKDGYKTVQLGFEDTTAKHLSKPELGHLKKAGDDLKRVLREVALDNYDELNVGDVITCDIFAAGDRVDVTGISKGKGYAGVVKRYGFHVQKVTHGGGPIHRHPGSSGPATDPSRVFKGTKKAGHMGSEQVTVQNLDVVQVDEELGLLAICGAIPGPKGGVVLVKSSVKKLIEKKGEAGTSSNPQKASARINPQKASARNK